MPKFTKVAKEFTYKDSWFDFYCETKEGKKYYIEIKNVPLADHVDILKKERAKISNENFKEKEKIAIFPDGYWKHHTEPVSVRAIKHLRHLEELT